MCSLSWSHHARGYEVYFNRDEKKTRGRAMPPTLCEHQGVRYLSPRDADAGGTWLLSNEHGLTLALLNYWDVEALERTAARSRGALLRDLASQRSAEACLQQMREMSLLNYGRFTLAAFDRTQTQGPEVVRWDGSSLISLPAVMPLCSSSFMPAAVIASRQQSFHRLVDHQPETLWRWHSEETSPTAHTVRMNRPDAQTWSISRVTLTAECIRWHYLEEPPDLKGSPQVHEVILEL